MSKLRGPRPPPRANPANGCGKIPQPFTVQWRSLIPALALAAAVALVGGCGDDAVITPPPPPALGAIDVGLTVTGPSPDRDGCAVSLDGAAESHIESGATVTYSDLQPGSHTVLLSDLARNCTVSGNNPQTVTVTANQTSNVEFDVTCEGLYSSFDVSDDVEGWTAWENGDGQTSWEDGAACGDGVGGCISITDEAADRMAFRAPEEWLQGSDWSDYYGGRLLYSIKYSAPEEGMLDLTGIFNVRISNGSHWLQMYFQDSYERTWRDSWQEIAINLSAELTMLPDGEVREWYDEDRQLASEEQVRNVLSKVTNLLIRGEFVSGEDTAYLDEVWITATPDPDERGFLYEAAVAYVFAPILFFDKDQGEWESALGVNQPTCYPSDAGDYFDFPPWKVGDRVCNRDHNSVAKPQWSEVPTYFRYQRADASTEYVAYWFFYGFQANCSWGKGQHDSDWEHIIVKIVNRNLDRVQYYQHEGWYTLERGNYPSVGNHPIVYPGKLNHGSYHDYGGSWDFSGYCCYWNDLRKPTFSSSGFADKYLATYFNLHRLSDGWVDRDFEGEENYPLWMRARTVYWKGPAEDTVGYRKHGSLLNLPGCGGTDCLCNNSGGDQAGCCRSDLELTVIF